MEKENMQNKKPMVLVLAGPNGSGKSTITTFFEKVGRYTNADDMVAATGMNNMDAALLADKLRYESIEKKEDFTFETVLSSNYKLDILRKAKEEGYFIKCVFVLTELEIDIYTVAIRQQLGDVRSQSFAPCSIRNMRRPHLVPVLTVGRGRFRWRRTA